MGNDADGLELYVVEADKHKAMVWVIGAPAVLHDEELASPAVMGYADDFHTMVVGCGVVFEFALTFVLHISIKWGNDIGYAALEGESGLSDVAFPTNGMTGPYIIYNNVHERIDWYVHECI